MHKGMHDWRKIFPLGIKAMFAILRQSMFDTQCSNATEIDCITPSLYMSRHSGAETKTICHSDRGRVIRAATRIRLILTNPQRAQ